MANSCAKYNKLVLFAVPPLLNGWKRINHERKQPTNEEHGHEMKYLCCFCFATDLLQDKINCSCLECSVVVWFRDKIGNWGIYGRGGRWNSIFGRMSPPWPVCHGGWIVCVWYAKHDINPLFFIPLIVQSCKSRFDCNIHVTFKSLFYSTPIFMRVFFVNKILTVVNCVFQILLFISILMQKLSRLVNQEKTIRLRKTKSVIFVLLRQSHARLHCLRNKIHTFGKKYKNATDMNTIKKWTGIEIFKWMITLHFYRG